MKKNKKNPIWNLFWIFIIIAFISFVCYNIHSINIQLNDFIPSEEKHWLHIHKFIDWLFLISLFIALFWNIYRIFDFLK